jgi:hypothetical protein
MSVAYSTHGTDEKNPYRLLWLGNLKGRDNLGDLGIEGWIR